jgi:hypothetical protein
MSKVNQLFHHHHFHIRSRYFRRCLAVVIVGDFAMHYLTVHGYIPDIGHWSSMLLNCVFFYDPVVAEMDVVKDATLIAEDEI